LPDNLPSHKWLGYFRKMSLMTELDSFTPPFLQICQSYGLRRLRVLRATKNSNVNSTHGSGATPELLAECHQHARRPRSPQSKQHFHPLKLSLFEHIRLDLRKRPLFERFSQLSTPL
jgi:hypothetical protein